MEKKRIFVAGHNGMVGSAVCRYLSEGHDLELITKPKSELDLTNQQSVRRFFEECSIDEVYLCAAKVGGIYANNKFPADFIYKNLMIQANVIDAAHQGGVNKLLCLGSSCIYPKYSIQPISEDQLLTGILESTNEPYAIAKIAGIKLCESYNRQFGRDYRSIMPTNLYGPGDNFHPENSHVVPALIERFHKAKENKKEKVVAWGTGSPMREFLYVDDLAEAAVKVMGMSSAEFWGAVDISLSHLNVGVGEDISIKQLTELVADVVGFKGEIEWDASKPDGTPRKLLNVDKINRLGWASKTPLREGLELTYRWFVKNETAARC